MDTGLGIVLVKFANRKLTFVWFKTGPKILHFFVQIFHKDG
jgi:hypothetical protein